MKNNIQTYFKTNIKKLEIIIKWGFATCPALFDSVPFVYKGTQIEVIYQKKRMTLRKAITMIKNNMKRKL